MHASALPGPFDLPVELAEFSGFAFFEEIGWRGYLLPLVRAASPRRPAAAPFVVALLHGIYHLPVVFLVAGAYLTEGNRWLTVPVFLAVLTAGGGVYGWLRDRSGSVWPVVIAHAAIDLGFDVVESVWTPDSDTVALIGRETGVATLAFLLLAVAVLYSRPTRRTDSAGGAEVRPEPVPARP